MKSSSAVERRASTEGHREFLSDVLAGLRQPRKHIPCKYFYDQRGSELFDRICLLDEYYLTRCELAIMEHYATEMGEQIGRGSMLVEYGSGSSVKTRYLLDGLPDPVAYVPVDISGEHLRHTAAELARDYPRIEVLPVCARLYPAIHAAEVEARAPRTPRSIFPVRRSATSCRSAPSTCCGGSPRCAAAAAGC